VFHLEHFHKCVQAIGREIFELAEAAKPRVWQKAWWLEQATRLLDHDERLRTRAFQFVDCLPSLTSNAELVRHLAEYFDEWSVDFPRLSRAVVGPGPFRRVRRELVGRAARFGAAQMAGRFITAYDVPSAIGAIERLRDRRMAFTIDVLGESTTSYARADRYAQVYHELIERLSPIARQWSTIPIIDSDARGAMPRVNLSIKLTGLDPHFDAIDPERSIREAGKRLRPLLLRARRMGAFVNIDMESTKHRAITLELFKRVLLEEEFRDWSDVGIVVQAYLRDGEQDLAELLEWGRQRGGRFAVRLVKGAYWDAETAAAVRSYQRPPVWTSKWESDACYERMTRTMLRHTDLIRPAFASHNVRSLAVVLATAEELGVPPTEYEVQTLFGMGDPLKSAMVQLGQCVRVYCPYGDLMPGMGYLIRRLLENTSNEGFLKQSFQDRGTHDQLLADPAVAKPPSAPLPARHYQNTDPEEPMAVFKNASNTDFASGDNREKMLGAIAYIRGEHGRTYPLIIGDQSISTKAWFESINPSHPHEVLGQIAQATTADADRTVAAARRAFGGWRLTSAAKRAQLLREAADRMEMRRFELAATMILEVGKPWREADADVTEAVDHWRYYADQIERIESRPRLRNLPGEDNMLTYSPKGVCAVISPYAFPLAILSGMASAALAAGNTVVIKPSRQASVVAAKLVELLCDIGLPPGVVNFLPGPGATVGRFLVEHTDVNIVAFTGSYGVGSGVLRAGASGRPGQAFIKKTIVEMGGKNAIIIDSDADLDGAVSAVVSSAFAYAGQKCSSCSRLIVIEDVYDALLPRLCDAVESVAIGPAEAPSTMVGPVIDEDARRRICEYIDIGKAEGRLLIQAKLPAECREGYYVAPTVLADVMPDARIAQEEIVGPVLAVIRAKDFDHAIRIANNSPYALTGGLFSRSPAHIERARRDFAVGNLYINRRITGSQVDAQPFGGFKRSGSGVKAGSPDYLLHFMDARCITENTLRSGLVPDEEPQRTPGEVS
jgi:RHH-type proline utilization regulon transcriptional repressor/proline dehydrogenase/delta 1-pyrroline-5-carboxylate dehydrogenase